jgi:ATP-dependent DNA helicase RecG
LRGPAWIAGASGESSPARGKRTANLFPEILPREVTDARGLVSARTALQSVHRPASRTDLEEGLRRLKYEELFRFQIKLAMKRRTMREESGGIAFVVKSPLARRLADSLPFALTRAQVRVVREISGDMASPGVMNRLLQGDVGSGKTVVALFAMLIAADNGYQSVFMAPTELLAEQHFRTLRRLLADIPVNIRLLVGAQKSALRRDLLEDIRTGARADHRGDPCPLREGGRLRAPGVRRDR